MHASLACTLRGNLPSEASKKICHWLAKDWSLCHHERITTPTSIFFTTFTDYCETSPAHAFSARPVSAA